MTLPEERVLKFLPSRKRYSCDFVRSNTIGIKLNIRIHCKGKVTSAEYPPTKVRHPPRPTVVTRITVPVDDIIASGISTTSPVAAAATTPAAVVKGARPRHAHCCHADAFLLVF